jgi:uncharacterized delta-60 repeat protein
MRSTLLLAALSAAMTCANPAHATDGDLDVTFTTDAVFPGYAFYPNPYGSLYSYGEVLRVAPGGQLYLIGAMFDTPNTQRISIQRADANGYPDYDFGNAGLRTYQRPCTSAFVSDAAIDAQGRIWVSFSGCDDFTVYRFTAAGDLDANLLGTGVLNIAFDLGDDNVDQSRRLTLTPDGGIVVAGSAAALPVQHLAVARYTAGGLPFPGFGVDGKVSLPNTQLFSHYDGLHLMDDGRIVVTGKYSPNPLHTTQAIVRLQANGAVDAGFGNHAPGISKADMAALTEHPDRPVVSGGSLLERDGSILQVGGASYGSPNASRDYIVMKWRPDGQLDTSIGAFGFRRYGLDFAGANPDDPAHNFDRAKHIVRQGDGKYLILGESYSSDGSQGISLIRLTRELELDPTFGDAGKLRHLSAIAANDIDCMATVDLLLTPGRILAAADVCYGADGELMQTVVGMTNDLLFADSFD